MEKAVESEAKREPKKLYSSPELTVYGTVRELTHKVGLHGNTDGGTGFKIKTHI